MKTAALVITTYNNPKYLGICLKSLLNQTSKDFDIFIADDGSTGETKAKINSLKPCLLTRVEHFWHADEGYRKTTIDNEVFRHINGYPVTICVDGDVILHRRFIEDHLSAHTRIQRGCFMGRRVELGPRISETISEDNVCDFNRGLSTKLFISGLTGDSKNILRAVRISNPLLQRLFKRNRVLDLLGSNFSVTTELLYEVNGYNEDYRSYWGEDGDLFIRLRNSGAQIHGAKSFAVQYHLHHKRLVPNPDAQKRYQELLNDCQYRRCSNGIVKDRVMPAPVLEK